MEREGTSCDSKGLRGVPKGGADNDPHSNINKARKIYTTALSGY